MPSSRRMQVEERKTVSGLVTVDGRAFPLRATQVRARAAGGMAATVLFQEYTNPHAEPLEVVYSLPIPADGAVVGYTIHLGERVVRGVVERREEAAERYRDALMEGRTAGLLQQERSDTFTQTLGCLPPGVPVRVEIEVIHPCALRPGEGGRRLEWEYRFPTVLGVRYEGDPGRVPDADALDAPRADEAGVPVRLVARVAILDGAPDRVAPRCPDCRVDVSFDGRSSVVVFDPSRLDRDLVLRWNASHESVGATLIEGAGLPGDEGRYALLTLTPPAVVGESFARDVTVLLDVSGSMTGAPLEHAKRIVHALLDALTERDQFQILAFSSAVVKVTDGIVAATASAREAARARLDAQRAGGCTEMRKAIDRALDPLRRESQRQVVLVTDGYIGFEHEIIGRVRRAARSACRLHVVGVGSAPNRTLTRGASRAGRGVEVLVGTSDDVGQAAERLRRATSEPVLMDLRVSGTAVKEIAPESPRDVFGDQHATIFLELGSKGGTVEVEARLAGRTEPWIRRIEVAPLDRDAAAPVTLSRDGAHRAAGAEAPDEDPKAMRLPLGACFGRERVEDCEEELAECRGEGDEGLLQRIEDLGLRHRIVTRCTSLVAVSETPTVDPRDPRRRERLAVEIPADVSAEGVGLFGRGGATLEPDDESMTLSAAPFVSVKYRNLVLRDKGATRFGKTKHLLYRICKTQPPADRGEVAEKTVEPLDEPSLATNVRPLDALIDDGTYVLPGRTVRFENELLVVELEAPPEGFVMLQGGATIVVVWESGRTSVGEIDGALSTRPGGHEEGLIVRMALRLLRPPSGRPAQLWWIDPDLGPVVIDLGAGRSSTAQDSAPTGEGT